MLLIIEVGLHTPDAAGPSDFEEEITRTIVCERGIEPESEPLLGERFEEHGFPVEDMHPGSGKPVLFERRFERISDTVSHVDVKIIELYPGTARQSPVPVDSGYLDGRAYLLFQRHHLVARPAASTAAEEVCNRELGGADNYAIR